MSKWDQVWDKMAAELMARTFGPNKAKGAGELGDCEDVLGAECSDLCKELEAETSAGRTAAKAGSLLIKSPSDKVGPHWIKRQAKRR